MERERCRERERERERETEGPPEMARVHRTVESKRDDDEGAQV